MGKDKRQTQTQRLDPASQAYVDRMRGAGRGAAADVMNHPGSFFVGPDNRSIDQIIAPFLDPYMSQVVDSVRGEFDNLRSGASRDAAQGATAAGAFNSSRHGVAEGVRLGALDRAQAGQIGGLLSSGFQNAVNAGIPYAMQQRMLQQQQRQEPIFRRQLQQGFLSGAMGPVGWDQTQIQKGNLWGDIVGAGLMVGGALTGNPLAGMVGAGNTAYSNGPGPARYTYMDDVARARPNFAWGS